VLINNDVVGIPIADLFATYAYDALNGMDGLDAEYNKQLAETVRRQAQNDLASDTGRVIRSCVCTLNRRSLPGHARPARTRPVRRLAGNPMTAP